MKTYDVNMNIVYLSWLSLLLWVLSSAAFIFLLAVRNPYWFLPMAGVVFLVQWLSIVSTYPKAIIIDDKNVIFIMAADSMVKVEFDQLKVNATQSAFALEFTRGGVTRKLRLARKRLSDELTAKLESIPVRQ